MKDCSGANTNVRLALAAKTAPCICPIAVAEVSEDLMHVLRGEHHTNAVQLPAERRVCEVELLGLTGLLPKDSALLVTSPKDGCAVPADASKLNRNSFQQSWRPWKLLGLPMVRLSTAFVVCSEMATAAASPEVEATAAAPASATRATSALHNPVELGVGLMLFDSGRGLLVPLGLSLKLAHDLRVARFELLRPFQNGVQVD